VNTSLQNFFNSVQYPFEGCKKQGSEDSEKKLNHRGHKESKKILFSVSPVLSVVREYGF